MTSKKWLDFGDDPAHVTVRVMVSIFIYLFIYLFIITPCSTAHIHENYINTEKLKKRKQKTSKVAHELQLNRRGRWMPDQSFNQVVRQFWDYM